MQSVAAVVDGLSISAVLYPARRPNHASPLLVAVHGGGYTHKYFTVPGSTTGSFVDIANRNGFSVLGVDRPGYGATDLLAEPENTFARHAQLLDDAIAHGTGSRRGISFAGGPFDRRHDQPRKYCQDTGVGASRSFGYRNGCVYPSRRRGRSGRGAADVGFDRLAGARPREELSFRPPDSYSSTAAQAARESYAPAPMVELAAAPRWAAERLAQIAPNIEVSVYHALGEFDALWDSSAAARSLFLAAFDARVSVESEIVAAVGHSLDHHLLGATVHYKQLGFAHRCGQEVIASRNSNATAGSHRKPTGV